MKNFDDITTEFAKTGNHPAIGEADIAAFRDAVESAFGVDEEERLFVFEQYDKCVVINYPNAVKISLVPKIADIARRFGMNASEF
ncbi:UNVERIFIED_CONTAM: hypothetical protein Q9R58_07430 [Methylobacteriaceae bacterium AG10]|nr:hypothetical protein [Methylobacteriaceae bacterium AG10]